MSTLRFYRSTARLFQLFLAGCLLVFALLPVGATGAGHPALAAATILYVKPGAPGNCSSWGNACALGTALATASLGNEIWAAAGVYKSGAGGNRNASIQLVTGVAVYGGFNGTESLLSQRNPLANLSILSGDIDNNDSQKPVITDLTTVTGNTTNSYHVVTGAPNAILDGFTITAGYADGSALYSNWGGGIFDFQSNPWLMNVNLVGNFAHFGGGMANKDNSNAKLTNVTFRGNSALHYGGGMFNDLDSHTELLNVTFSFNTADLGGGMENNYHCNSSLTNVTFSNNTAGWGGGMFNDSSSPSLTNVTFTDNSANIGGGIYNDGSSPVINNTILWGNTVTTGTGHQVYNTNASNPNLYYTIVQAGCPAGSTCTNVINGDPLLYGLGNFGGFTQTVPITPGSAAIDVADDALCPPYDQRGVPRPVGPHCDIGAFEFLPYHFQWIYLPLVIR